MVSSAAATIWSSSSHYLPWKLLGMAQTPTWIFRQLPFDMDYQKKIFVSQQHRWELDSTKSSHTVCQRSIFVQKNINSWKSSKNGQFLLCTKNWLFLVVKKSKYLYFSRLNWSFHDFVWAILGQSSNDCTNLWLTIPI